MAKSTKKPKPAEVSQESPATIDPRLRWRFEAVLQEYVKLRDESVQRVLIQNDMIQRGTYLAAGTAAVVVALFKVFTDATASPGSPAGDLPLPFLLSSLAIIFVYGILIQLLLYNWIYQLWMMFRILAYRVWVNENVLRELVGKTDDLFLWETGSGRSAPWNKPFQMWPFSEGFGQVGPLYGLAVLAPLCMIGFSGKLVSASCGLAMLGFLGAGLLVAALVTAGYLQRKVHALAWQVQESSGDQGGS